MRMTIMKMRLCCALLSFGVPLTPFAQQIDEKDKPNIILFLVDDMGWQDTSVPFGKERTTNNHKYHTPNMERLARAGMKFTDAYATPVCTPTRVSLMSGMNAAHHRVTNWTSPLPNRSSDYPDTLFFPVKWNISGMSTTPAVPNTVYVTPLPQILKDAGYYTIHTGKAHFASTGVAASDTFTIRPEEHT